MPSIDVIIDLSRDECEAHYAGSYQRVYVSGVDGRRVLLPAGVLRRVVLDDGVHGVFRLTYSAQGKFQSIHPVRRLSSE